MKAALPQNEPKQLAEWEAQGIYHRIQEERAGNSIGTFVLHDGPPYPTGEIHLGTGLNKTLKDLVVKSKTMAGYRAPYLPGWDCHGLPIETKVEKELGGKGKVPPAEFRRLCREFAARFIDNHRREFKRLGIFGQWEKPYLTMDFNMEAAIADALVTFYERGYAYRGLKPVYWCMHDSTALAEAEVEYEDHTSPSIWIRFPATGSAAAKLGAEVAAAAWTTTPWSLPGTVALALHPDYHYVVAETSAGKLLLAAERVETVMSDLGVTVHAVSEPWKGRELAGLEFRHPFLDRNTPAVLADYVTLDRGTGVVTTAPGHGAEDFFTGQKYGLQTYAPVDDEGRFTEGLPEYLGKSVFDANPHIIELLKSRGMLLGHAKYTHSYPHCWRCHNPVIFRATEQWFINLEHNGLRPKALEAIKKVHWKPEWGQERMATMVGSRPDWCFSRQRFWGVPIVAFYCEACHHLLTGDFAAHHKAVEIFRTEGSDAWFKRPAEDFVPAGTKCEKCGGTTFSKETDILDVWFESGSTHHGVLGTGGEDPRTKEAGPWPADVYLEGPDQYRGWFQSSLLVAMGIKGAPPFRTIVTHGWTLDEKGQPMSKSRGNAIYPAEICERWGADMLRVWVCWQDYTADVSLSVGMMDQIGEAYRKVRNTLRFALSNLYDFDPGKDALPDEQLTEFDRYMLHRAGDLVAQCRAWYDSFDFHRVFHAIHDFCVVDLSAFYFDVLKDRLYTAAKRSSGRRSAQTVVYRIAHALARLLAPVTVFTSEEIWKFLPRHAADTGSVHMALFPAASAFDAGLPDSIRGEWDKLLQVRGTVLKALEDARNAKFINSALEARVILRAEVEWASLLTSYLQYLPALFIASQVEVETHGEATDRTSAVDVRVERAHGTKCERCWNYSTHVGESARWPALCERCVSALEENIRTLGTEAPGKLESAGAASTSGGSGGAA